MNGELRVYIDQFGNTFRAMTVKDLKAQIPGRCRKMYQDMANGVCHVGYVIGQHWLTMFAPVRTPVN